MFKNYLKLALRNFLRFKGYSMLNILGLAVGIAACLLIVQHLRDELRYDQQHPRLGDLYRVGTSFSVGDESTDGAVSPSPLAWTLVQDYPEVESAARLFNAPLVDKYLIKFRDKSYFEQNGHLVDSTFFRLLRFDFMQGDPKHALDEPNTVVLTAPLAQKIFGTADPMHQTIQLSDPFGAYDFKVTGVIGPNTYRSHIDGNLYLNSRSTASGQRFYDLREWAGNNLYYTYIRLREGADPKALEAKLPALVEAKAGERLRTLGFHKTHFLEPVSDIYLHSKLSYPVGPTGNMSMIYIFSAIGLFILVIACINFMNLATAKATIRAREVGVRKVVGASRQMLIQQFLSESLVYSVAAVLLAVAGAKLLLPWFNELAGKQLFLDLLNDPVLLAWIAGITLFTALLAGSYPALYLSRFSPVSIFRGKFGDRFSARQVRRALVILQFVVSIGLIQGILVIQQQLDFIRNKDLGFEKDARLVVQLNTSGAVEKFSTLRDAFVQQAGVLTAGGSTAIPGGPNIQDMLFYGEGKSPEEKTHSYIHFVDPGFLETMQFNLLAGRLFDENRPTDSVDAAVITESMMRGLGYTLENAVGRKFYRNWDGTVQTQTIIGVVADFHAASLRDAMEAHTFFCANGGHFTYLVAGVSTENLSPLIGTLEASWKRINPGEPFEYYFLDEKLQQAYLADQRTSGLITAFTILALFISCLGLFGLAAFAAESRTKEIGVRKVLGASVGNIVSLLSRDFILLVLFAMVIATPIAWYFMRSWLQEFQYHVHMPWWTFGLAGIAAILVTFVTVSGQSLKAALSNPVNSLRSE